VQTVLALNNAGVQALGNPSFTYSSTTVQETSWVCVNDRNGNEQERSRTTTTATTGIVSSIARVKNQITGYNLSGFTGPDHDRQLDRRPAHQLLPEREQHLRARQHPRR
jgi:hypothetical protein